MPILYDNEKKIFTLQATDSTYQMRIHPKGFLLHSYYGKRTWDMDMSYTIKYADRGFSGNPYELGNDRTFSLDTVPQEYPGYGMGDHRISGVQISTRNGSRCVDLRYDSHEIKDGKYHLTGLPAVHAKEQEAQTLSIYLKDRLLGLTVILEYGLLKGYDVITRAVRFINKSEDEITLEKAASFCLDIPFGKWDLINFYGRHEMERQPERNICMHGVQSIENKRGISSHHQNPFMLLCEHDATEDYGMCYGAMLVYSGNHMTQAEMDSFDQIRIVGGIHPEQFSWKLSPGDRFETPEVILGFSSRGLTALSQQYHRLIREHVCRGEYQAKRSPVLINNWEATYFDFNENKILSLAKEAKKLGIELFVLDDGWFGQRNSDQAGLGDWKVNVQKLPDGIDGLADKINKLGMKFGLWIEPEAVNENSDLYRSHPEWALTVPQRKPTRSRFQLVLDMSRKEVVDYLFESYTAILDHANVEYIKWDMNRPLVDVYSNALPSHRQGEVLHRYVLGVYDLMDRLTRRYPHILFEGCAGGGGRFDAGILYYSPQIWCSDNTDPIDRLRIQYGTSFGYPVKSVGAHVSASPNHQTGRNTPLETRAVTAMSGTFGYELDLEKLSQEEKEKIKTQISNFKQYAELIHQGDYYRLTNPMSNQAYCAWEFVSPDRKEVLLNLVVTRVIANNAFINLHLKGLNAKARYQIPGEELIYTGAALMNGGYTFPIQRGNYPAVQVYLREIEGVY